MTTGPTEPRFADLAAVARADSERRRRIAAYGRTIDDPLGLAVVRACRGQPELAVVRALEAIRDRATPGKHDDDLYVDAYRIYLAARIASAAGDEPDGGRYNGHPS